MAKMKEADRKNFTLLFNVRERIRSSKQGDQLRGPLTVGELVAIDEAISVFYRYITGQVVSVSEETKVDTAKSLAKLADAEQAEKEERKKRKKKK